MVVVSKRNILFTAPDKVTKYRLARNYMGPVPEWVTKLPYFSELVAAGKILIAEKTAKQSDKTEGSEAGEKTAEQKETKKSEKADKSEKE